MKIGVSRHETRRAEMGENRAVVVVLIVGENTLQTSPDLPEGEEGLAVRGATTSPDLPEGGGGPGGQGWPREA